MGGNRDDTSTEAIIDLQCGSGEEKVEFLRARHRLHEFRWTSPHACGRAINGASSSSLMIDKSNEKPKDGGKKDSGEEKSPSDDNDDKPENDRNDGERQKQPSDDEEPSKKKPADDKEPPKQKPSDDDKSPKEGEDGKKPSGGGGDKPSKEPTKEPPAKAPSKEPPNEKHPDHSRHAPTPTATVPASRPSSLPSKDKDSGNPIPPPSKDEDLEDDQNLKFPGTGPQRSIAITTLTIASFSLVTVACLLYAPPRPLRRWVQRHLKRRQFRVGEVRLVRWANEDDDTFGMDEDEMVNDRRGEDEYVFDDESIPLKPSPRKYRHAHYGSASWS
ncbi:hypothetical protein CONPUDRAFT_169056 [Coniophora puteana RWD-64-598 SS2]|uniref:Uncharacterized protein n=1 Tax=Coniophora puteana (strain RWD-64-598) TaxID=741705 RepID=A0A5M3MAY3_CONPW|nr:uncharacterized protein CONPUDRAFT_169056 [Coniophora puteana RWD-64-598 SS2]EIW75775.1 hypothetical protein CONPUDRAFT_169056 [Coniophora puteana RWD-64-598 SS2]